MSLKEIGMTTSWNLPTHLETTGIVEVQTAICRHPTAQRFERESSTTALVVKPICTVTQQEEDGGGICCIRTVCKHDTCIQRNLQRRFDLLTMGGSCRTMWSCYKQTRLPTPPTLPTSAIFTSSYLLDPLV